MIKTIPKKAKIKSAKLSLYPMNRVSVTIEKYGEWDIAMITANKLDDYLYDTVQGEMNVELTNEEIREIVEQTIMLAEYNHELF